MRKILSIVIIVLIAFSCGPSSDKNESIKAQIKEYKEEVSQLNIKIHELEQELARQGQQDEEYIIPVKVIELEKETFNHYFQVSGTVEAEDQAYISPEINGQVKEILVKEGDPVQKGQLLARLNTSITENTIEEVRTQLKLASVLFEKQKQLWDKNIGSEVQYLQAKNNKEALESSLETLQAQLEMAYIKSPIDGIVDAIDVKEGELAMPGLQIMMVLNLKRLKVMAAVSEKYLPSIQSGDIVHLNFPSFPGIELNIPVHRTGNVINKGNRTFPVELKLNNIDGKLKPNILAMITFLDYSKDNTLIVPSIIVRKDLQGEYLYVVHEQQGKLFARKVYVETGMSYDDKTMVTSGLKAGDMVITDGYTIVTDGSEVKVI